MLKKLIYKNRFRGFLADPGTSKEKILVDMEKDEMPKPPKVIQFFITVFLIVAGVALLFCSMFIPPHGEIHPSVLAAFGMILTFVGTTLGIDYNYKTKFFQFTNSKMTVKKKTASA